MTRYGAVISGPVIMSSAETDNGVKTLRVAADMGADAHNVTACRASSALLPFISHADLS